MLTPGQLCVGLLLQVPRLELVAAAEVHGSARAVARHVYVLQIDSREGDGHRAPARPPDLAGVQVEGVRAVARVDVAALEAAGVAGRDHVAVGGIR